MFLPKIKTDISTNEYVIEKFLNFIKESFQKRYDDIEDVQNNWWDFWEEKATTFFIEFQDGFSLSITLFFKDKLNCFWNFQQIEIDWDIRNFNKAKVLVLLKQKWTYLKYKDSQIKWEMQAEKLIISKDSFYFENLKLNISNWDNKALKIFPWKWEYDNNHYLNQGNKFIYFNEKTSNIPYYVELKNPEDFFKSKKSGTVNHLDKYIKQSNDRVVMIDKIVEFNKGKEDKTRKLQFHSSYWDTTCIRYRKKDYRIIIDKNTNKGQLQDIDAFKLEHCLKQVESDEIVAFNSWWSFSNSPIIIASFKFWKTLDDVNVEEVEKVEEYTYSPMHIKTVPKIVLFGWQGFDFLLVNNQTILMNKLWKTLSKIEK